MFDVEEYETEDGKRPFSDWLNSLKDKKTQGKLLKRITRLELGNFGEYRDLKDGLRELKDDFGPGYRIYYSLVGNKLILLLAGSDKGDQDTTIKKAKGYLVDYERRQSK